MHWTAGYLWLTWSYNDNSKQRQSFAQRERQKTTYKCKNHPYQEVKERKIQRYFFQGRFWSMRRSRDDDLTFAAGNQASLTTGPWNIRSDCHVSFVSLSSFFLRLATSPNSIHGSSENDRIDNQIDHPVESQNDGQIFSIAHFGGRCLCRRHS